MVRFIFDPTIYDVSGTGYYVYNDNGSRYIEVTKDDEVSVRILLENKNYTCIWSRGYWYVQ